MKIKKQTNEENFDSIFQDLCKEFDFRKVSECCGMLGIKWAISGEHADVAICDVVEVAREVIHDCFEAVVHKGENDWVSQKENLKGYAKRDEFGGIDFGLQFIVEEVEENYSIPEEETNRKILFLCDDIKASLTEKSLRVVLDKESNNGKLYIHLPSLSEWAFLNNWFNKCQDPNLTITQAKELKILKEIELLYCDDEENTQAKQILYNCFPISLKEDILTISFDWHYIWL